MEGGCISDWNNTMRRTKVNVPLGSGGRGGKLTHYTADTP